MEAYEKKRKEIYEKKKKPAASSKKSGKAGPATKKKLVPKSKTTRVKKKRKKFDGSDVECIDVSEEESDLQYYQTKKCSKLGSASSEKFGKAGPASLSQGKKTRKNYDASDVECIDVSEE